MKRKDRVSVYHEPKNKFREMFEGVGYCWKLYLCDFAHECQKFMEAIDFTLIAIWLILFGCLLKIIDLLAGEHDLVDGLAVGSQGRPSGWGKGELRIQNCA